MELWTQGCSSDFEEEPLPSLHRQLIAAIGRSYVDAVQWCLAEGADPAADDCWALCVSARLDRAEILEALLAWRGPANEQVDVAACDHQALRWAIEGAVSERTPWACYGTPAASKGALHPACALGFAGPCARAKAMQIW